MARAARVSRQPVSTGSDLASVVARPAWGPGHLSRPHVGLRSGRSHSQDLAGRDRSSGTALVRCSWSCAIPFVRGRYQRTAPIERLKRWRGPGPVARPATGRTLYIVANTRKAHARSRARTPPICHCTTAERGPGRGQTGALVTVSHGAAADSWKIPRLTDLSIIFFRPFPAAITRRPGRPWHERQSSCHSDIPGQSRPVALCHFSIGKRQQMEPALVEQLADGRMLLQD